MIKTLTLSGKQKDLTFDEIVARVEVYFKPKPSPIIKRFEFNTRCQKEGNKVATFVAALRKIAEHSHHDGIPNNMCDCIVCGILIKPVQRCLLQEAGLTYTKSLDISLAADTAEKDARCLQDYGGDKIYSQKEEKNYQLSW